MQIARLYIATVFICCLYMFGCSENPINEREPIDFTNEGSLLKVKIETADVFGQGLDGPVVSENGATIRRTPNGISIQLSMPTPGPGTYDYPESGVAFSGPGYPEVFSH